MTEICYHPDRMESIHHAVTALAAGKPILVSSDSPDGDGADLVLAGAVVETQCLAWMIRHTSGFLCVALPEERADCLELPLMVRSDQHGRTDRCGFAVSVDAADGITTGISAADRCRTVRLLSDPETTAGRLTRPGHVMPIRVAQEGVLRGQSREAAAMDLCRVAGLEPVAVMGALVADEARVVDADYIASFAADHQVPTVRLSEVIDYRVFHGDGLRSRVTQIGTELTETAVGRVEVVSYLDEISGAQHMAVRSSSKVRRCPPVAIHLECRLGDLFGSTECLCSDLLVREMKNVVSDDGLLIYLRQAPTVHEERHVTDLRSMGGTVESAASSILRDLGVLDMRLVSGDVDAKKLAHGGVKTIDEREEMRVFGHGTGIRIFQSA